MNYIKGLKDYLRNEALVTAVVDGSIERIRIQEENKGTVSISFTEAESNSDYGQFQGDSVEEFFVQIHVACTYEKSIDGRELDRLLVRLLNGKQSLGDGTTDSWYGQIQYERGLGSSYDDQLDRVVWTTLYRFISKENC